MIKHPTHQMQLTSLYCYFPNYSEQEFNQAFRQKTKQDIIRLLQKHNNLTDREICNLLNYTDPNKVRPRRNELVKLSIVEESYQRKCMIGKKLSICWKLNPEKLYHYIDEKRN